MGPLAFYLRRLALLAHLATMSAAHASPFTAHYELEDLGPLPAGKRLADLHAGEAQTVRMIYVVPNDRPYRQDVVNSMKTTIRQVQAFFSDQLEDHGHGARTFRFETDADGSPVVHRLDGRHADSHYLDNTISAVLAEASQVFDLGTRQVNFYVVDNSTNLIDRFAAGVAWGGGDGGSLVVPGDFQWATVAHELGHAFGFPHDFRDGAYVMSYGDSKDRLSPCTAEFLAVHPYFTGPVTSEQSSPPTLQLLTPTEYPAGEISVPVQLSVSAPLGLHQVILLARTPRPHAAAGFLEVISCRGFEGEADTAAEFHYSGVFPSDGSTSLADPLAHPMAVQAVDAKGNTASVEFTLRSALTQAHLTFEGHEGRVHSVAFSPDGATLASAADDGTIKLWEVDRGTSTSTLDAPGVESLAFSPRGTTLASGSQDGTVILWDVGRRASDATLEGHTGLVQVVAFSPDGSTLASGSSDQTVKLWDAEEGIEVATLEEHMDAVESVAFSPDGSVLASGASDGTIWLWNAETGESIAGLRGSASAVQSLAFSPDGSTLASGSYPGGVVRLWDVATGGNIAALRGGLPCRVSTVAFSPDGSTLAFGSGDQHGGTIELWDTGTRRKRTTLSGHGGAVESMAFSPDGVLASASWDRTVRLWDLSEWTEPRLWTLDIVSGDLQEGRAGTPLEDPLVVELRDQQGNVLKGVVVTFSIQTGEGRLGGRYTVERATTDANGRARSTLTLGPKAGPAVVEVAVPGPAPVTFRAEGVGATPTLAAIDYRTADLPEGAISRLAKGTIGGSALSPDGQYLALAGSIGAWLYDMETLREVSLFRGHARDVNAVAFSRDGSTLLTGSLDTTVKLWDLATGVNTTTLEGHPGGVTSLAFTPDGSVLASGSYRFIYGEGVVFLWDAATGQNTSTLWGHTSTVLSVAISPDGSTLASAGYDETIRLWNLQTGTHIATIETHAGIYSVAFSLDGRKLAAGLHDGRLRIWDAITGESIANYQEKDDWLGWAQAVHSVTFTPDGKSIAYGGIEGKVKLRNLATGRVTFNEEHGQAVNSVAISSDGTTLVASGTSRVTVWNLETQNTTTLEGYSAIATSVAFSPDGTVVAMGTQEGTAGWNIETGERVIWEEQGIFPVGDVVFSPDGQILASAVRHRIELLDTATGVVTTLSGHTSRIRSMAFSSDGGTLASGGDDGKVLLWDTATGQSSTLLEDPEVWVGFVALSPDEGSLAASLSDGRWMLWDGASRTLSATLDDPPGWIAALLPPDPAVLEVQGKILAAFSPDGTTSASWKRGGLQANRFRLWDLSTGKVIATLEGHAASVEDVAYSPDGSILASVSHDGTVLLWDLQRILPHAKTLTKISGDEQEGSSGTELVDSFVVEVRDQNGDLFEGARVTFAVTAGDGTLSTATDTTDARGRAATTLTLGQELGSYSVEVAVEFTVAEVEPVAFTATSRANPDFDGDGEVGLSDFFLFAESFGGSDPRFDLDSSGSVDFADFFLFAESFDQPARAKLLALARERIGLPDGPQLQQNAPNPFNSGTVISWFLLQDGPARLEVYALTGQRVAVLSRGPHKAGLYRFRWDGRDAQGRPLASGVYLYRLVTPKGVHTRKLTLLR